MLCTSLDNFYLTDEELLNSPSRQNGVDEETERNLRVFGAQLVQEATILLKCPQAVAATGQVLLQRFYCKRSFTVYNVKKLAAAATYLAIKLEECTTIRIRDLIMVFDRLYSRKDQASRGHSNPRILEPGTNEYHKAKDAVIAYERELLRVFGFIVHVDHPHKLLISLLNVLDADKALMQEAWNIANDSLRTTLCVRFKSEVVASGAIFYAARRLQVALPETLELGDGTVCHWWEAFNVKTEQLVAVVDALHTLYQHPAPKYIEVRPMPEVKSKPATNGTVKAPATVVQEPEKATSPAVAPGSAKSGATEAVSQQDGAVVAGDGNAAQNNNMMEIDAVGQTTDNVQQPSDSQGQSRRSSPAATQQTSVGNPRDSTSVAAQDEVTKANGSRSARSRSHSRERRDDRRRHSRSRSRDRSYRDRDRDREKYRDREGYRERERDRDYRSRDSYRDRDRRDRDRDRDRRDYDRYR